VSQNGKGDARRPRLVPREQWDRNYEVTFKVRCLGCDHLMVDHECGHDDVIRCTVEGCRCRP